VTLARRVAPGREIEFDTWAADLTGAASGFPGFLGAGMLRPGHVGEDWHVVYRFDSSAHLEKWEHSPERTQLLDRGKHLMETTAVNRVSGLETWFSLPGRTAPAPPKWKMFLVSVVGIFTLNLIFRVLVDHAVEPWPLALRVGLGAAGVTVLMTWVVMPRAARLLEKWLYAAPHGPHRRTSY
jgi:antibiotic biosynthesis monooxygenase (ABM) superfamily enzyme